jgi:hypothetical protein
MRFREYPLLNAPNLVVIILRRGLDAPATRADCAATLEGLLARADEHPPFGPDEVAARLDTLIRYLTEAKLVEPVAGGAFATTARGRAALAEHPQGLDTPDLMAYPEFARFIGDLGRRQPGLDPRAGGYDQGFYAYWRGQVPADNPYPPDSADHLAWENGWSEALDEDFRPAGPRAAP